MSNSLLHEIWTRLDSCRFGTILPNTKRCKQLGLDYGLCLGSIPVNITSQPHIRSSFISTPTCYAPAPAGRNRLYDLSISACSRPSPLRPLPVDVRYLPSFLGSIFPSSDLRPLTVRSQTALAPTSALCVNFHNLLLKPCNSRYYTYCCMAT